MFDGHESHVSLEFLEYCKSNKIVAICMPPHSTHLLQPLDVGVFSPLQHYYSAEVDNLVGESGGLLGMTKRQFWKCFWPAHKQALISTTIKSAWKKSGYFPFNIRPVLNNLQQEYAPGPSTPTTARSLPSVPNTPKTIRSTRRLHKLAVRKPIKINIETLGKAAEVAITENEILRHEIDGLRKALLDKTKSGGKRRLGGSHAGKVWTDEEIIALRRKVDAREASKAPKKRHGRPKKVQEPLEVVEDEIIMSTGLSPPPTTVEAGKASELPIHQLE